MVGSLHLLRPDMHQNLSVSMHRCLAQVFWWRLHMLYPVVLNDGPPGLPVNDQEGLIIWRGGGGGGGVDHLKAAVQAVRHVMLTSAPSA